MAEPVVFVGGSKGGVGKSMVSHISTHKFYVEGKNPIVIDTDNQNEDVYLTYKKIEGVNAYKANLDRDHGWENILRIIIDNKEERPVVINSRAANITTMKDVGNQYMNFIREKANLVCLWPVDRCEDVLKMMKDFVRNVPIRICAIKNGKEGFEDDFTLFANGPEWLKNMPAVYLPKAPFNRFTEIMYNGKIPLHMMQEQLDLGEQITGKIWTDRVVDIISEAIEKATLIEV